MKKIFLLKFALFICFFSIIFPAYAESNNKMKEKEVLFNSSSKVKTFVLRLRPGNDLREELEKFVKTANIKAGFIITTVGSLKKTSLRLADESKTAIFEEKFEIVSLVGTLSENGVHLHISLSDKTGKTIGGHLLKGSLIYTTAEIIIGELDDIYFTRETDKETTFKELKFYKRKNN